MRALIAIVTATVALAAMADTEVSTPLLIRRGPSQLNVSVASSGAQFLAVWMDTANFDVRATRIEADGVVLDPASLHVAGALFASAWTPAVTWTGAHYLVAHETLSQTYVTTVSSDGEVGEPRPLLSGQATMPKLASSQAGTVVAARGFGGTIRVAAIDPNGTVTAEHLISAAMLDGPFIAPLGDQFLVVWSEFVPQKNMPRVLAAIISVRADIVSERRVVSEEGWLQPIASLGDRALVTYRLIPDSQNPEGLATELLARIVTTAGISEAVTIATAEKPSIANGVVIAHGDHFAVAWMRKAGEVDRNSVAASLPPQFIPTFDIDAASVSVDGVVLDRTVLVESDLSDENPAIASNGERLLLTWLERALPASPQRIAGGLSADITRPIERIEFAQSAPVQDAPRLASSGDVTLVVWTEDPENDGSAAVFARRLSASGRFLDPAPVRLSTGDRPLDGPAVAATDREFAVAWIDHRFQLLARRISIDGSLLDPVPLELGFASSLTAAIASDGYDFAALNVERSILSASIIRRSGEVEHHALTDYSPEGYTSAALVWDGARYLAAVPVPRVVGRATRKQVEILSFTRNGALLSGFSRVAGGDADEVNPSIACNRRSCLVAWMTFPGIRAATVAGARVTLLAPLTRTYSASPRLAASQDGYNVSWTTYERDTVSVFLIGLSENGTATTLPARLAGPLFVMISQDIADAHGALILAYSRSVEGMPYGGATRVFVRGTETPRRRAVRR